MGYLSAYNIAGQLMGVRLEVKTKTVFWGAHPLPWIWRHQLPLNSYFPST